MKHIRTAVILLLFVASSCGKAQVVVQTWVDPCTNTVPIPDEFEFPIDTLKVFTI